MLVIAFFLTALLKKGKSCFIGTSVGKQYSQIKMQVV